MTDDLDFGPSDLEYIESARREFGAEVEGIVDRLGLSHLKVVSKMPTKAGVPISEVLSTHRKVAPKIGIPISEVLERYASRRR
jgi:hypothetical protein